VLGTSYVAEDAAVADGATVFLLPPVSGGAGPDPLAQGLFELCAGPIDAAACQARVASPSCGAVVVFSGTAREENRGRAVVRLEYEAFRAMTGPEMARIFADARAELGLAADGAGDPVRRARMLVVHREGRVEIGEPAVVIAVASPHRDQAFRAARFLIDELKRRLPIWKKEVYADGHCWIGDRS
jgi:molybdopterin synthase catalytic subunit